MHEPFDQEPRLPPAPATAVALARRLADQKQIAEFGTYAFTEPDYQAVMDRAVELAEVVNLCLEPNEHGRWKNMHAVTRQLDKVLASMPMRSRTA